MVYDVFVMFIVFRCSFLSCVCAFLLCFTVFLCVVSGPLLRVYVATLVFVCLCFAMFLLFSLHHLVPCCPALVLFDVFYTVFVRVSWHTTSFGDVGVCGFAIFYCVLVIAIA